MGEGAGSVFLAWWPAAGMPGTAPGGCLQTTPWPCSSHVHRRAFWKQTQCVAGEALLRGQDGQLLQHKDRLTSHVQIPQPGVALFQGPRGPEQNEDFEHRY